MFRKLALAAAATVALGAAALAPTDASARWQGGGWHHGGGYHYAIAARGSPSAARSTADAGVFAGCGRPMGRACAASTFATKPDLLIDV